MEDFCVFVYSLDCTYCKQLFSMIKQGPHPEFLDKCVLLCVDPDDNGQRDPGFDRLQKDIGETIQYVPTVAYFYQGQFHVYVGIKVKEWLESVGVIEDETANPADILTRSVQKSLQKLKPGEKPPPDLLDQFVVRDEVPKNNTTEMMERLAKERNYTSNKMIEQEVPMRNPMMPTGDGPIPDNFLQDASAPETWEEMFKPPSFKSIHGN